MATFHLVEAYFIHDNMEKHFAWKKAVFRHPHYIHMHIIDLQQRCMHLCLQ